MPTGWRSASTTTRGRAGKGWALSIGLIALPYYRVTNPVLAANALLSIEAVLDDD